jgi:predicted phage replisome organizer
MMDMRERKYIKFKVDMYDDTKSKIIDMKPERDLIHYVWNRFVVLAGKVNLEGNLYMSKNIPYTIETLAIEFNRGTYQVKLALDVLMELEMIELIENNVYRVKNFAKHQNIKVKEEIKSNDKEENIKNNEVGVKENSLNEAAIDREEVSLEVAVNEDEMVENKTGKDKDENIKENSMGNFKIIHKNINKNYDNMSDNNVSHSKLNSSQGNIQIFSETKKNKKSNKRKKKEVNIESIDENVEDDMICYFHEGGGGRPLGEGECVVKAWAF